MKEFELQKKYNWQLAHEKIGSTSSSHYLGEEYLGGIIFNLYTGADGLEHGHIVNLTETNTSLQDPTSLVGASSSWDGATNTNLYTNSLAKTWVESLGAGWYIPSIDELNILYNSRYYVNKSISTLGGTALAKDNNYWSSTEYNDDNAWALYFDNGGGFYYFKFNPNYVRAVKAF